LIVVVKEISTDKGLLRFSLFDSKKNFLKRPLKTGAVSIENHQGAWTVDDLAHGTYAVLVYHGVDGSGKMERHWYGKPKEPTGASNNPPPRMGPPEFDDAKFDFSTQEKRLLIAVE
jgi:uncharacterized protein (DUF2141 family)